jgi:hypothetical protein
MACVIAQAQSTPTSVEHITPTPALGLLDTDVANPKATGALGRQDAAVVLRDATAAAGDIVVAIVDRDCTIKQVAEDDNGFYLKPGNKKLSKR